MLPEGWKRVSLHKVAEVRTGLAKGKQGLKDPVELPYLRVANVQDGYLDLTEIKTIRIERADIERYSLKVGDVLMTEGGDFDKLGRGAVWRGEISLCLHQNHIFVVRPKREQLLPDFLSALTASAYGKNYFLGCAKRTTNLASINSSQVKAFPVLIPGLEEQREIGRVLLAWDKAIAVTDRLVANALQHKRALMRRLLRPRHPTDWREHGWDRRPLGEIVEIDRESLPGDTSPTFRFRYISLADVNNGVISETLPTLAFKEAPSRARRLVAHGDILLSTVRPSLKGYARITERHAGCVASTGFSVLTPLPGTSADYVYQYLYSEDIQRQVGAVVMGSSYPAINTIDVENLLINVPGLEHQYSIADVLNAIDRESGMLSAISDALREEKRALMSDLLTGKRRIRLPSPAETAA